MLSTFLNIFKIPELRNKIMFTLGMLVIYRIGFYVPVPGVDQLAMTASGVQRNVLPRSWMSLIHTSP